MSGLRKGYTTGTCAAIAARAAVIALVTGRAPERESVVVPCGERITAEIEDASIDGSSAECAVRKYAGDDPDVTDGLLIYSRVTLVKSGITVDGGEGVGRVTKPGLRLAVGEAAINETPRRMIISAAAEALEECGAECGAHVTVSVPGGRETAERTFNPRLGIEGGISILGTTGIVEPMSTKAVMDTIELELGFRRANGYGYALVTPGNYGRDYIMERFGTDIDAAVKCSNYIGFAIDTACEKGFKGMLLIGHAGKLIKLAAGIMNTHSCTADGRAEVICANAALEGAPMEALEAVMESVTTDDAAAVLKRYGLLDAVMERIAKRIEYHMDKRCKKRMKYAFIVFSNVYGELCRGGSEEVIKEALNEDISHRDGDGRRRNADR